MISARAILFSFVLTASTALAASTLAPAANALREKSIEAHGGQALENLKTYREDFSMNATILGVGVYNFRIKATVDYVGERGRLEFFNNGTLESIVQLTQEGTVSWSKKNGSKNEKNARKPGEEFTFSGCWRLENSRMKRSQPATTSRLRACVAKPSCELESSTK